MWNMTAVSTKALLIVQVAPEVTQEQIPAECKAIIMKDLSAFQQFVNDQGMSGLRISLNFLLHCIANLLANSSVSLVPTLRTRLVRSSKPGPPDVQRSGKGL